MRFVHSALAALAFLASASFVNADSPYKAPADGDSASDVIVLTTDSFEKVVNPEKLMLVEFYAPWCGHCQKLAPEYEKAATTLKKEGIKLAKVDCTEEADICSKFDVRGYPTLKVFRFVLPLAIEGTPKEYNGGRKEDLIISYMKKQALPAVSEVTSENLKTFSESDKVVIVGFFASKDADEYKTFHDTASKLRDDYLFGASVEAKLASDNEVKAPGIVLFKKFDERKVPYKGEFKSEDITSFIKTESVPLMDEVSRENYMDYVEAGKPLAFFFWDSEKVRNEIGPRVEAVAKEFKGKVNFVYIDANELGAHAENLNLKSQWPAFAISEIHEGLKFPFDQSKEITTENIREFVQSYIDGKIEPSLKSEAIPEKNDGPVKVVVGKTFEEIAMDEEKDVLLEFYAPCNGHCKRLEPIYNTLGTKLAPVADKITIAKMDATENDLPRSAKIRVEGFPTIKLFKAKTNEVVDFNGDRTLDGFIEFLRENALYVYLSRRPYNLC
ncbi:protein disulfide isomerase [Paraphysoderma sedebokerense]|nr:protein disulfide isomerase [Paraphysoderma sedebokerense]